MRSSYKQFLFISLLASLGFGGGASADASASAKATEAKRSPKKAAADTLKMKAPQVIEPGDHSLGLRASQGQSYNHQPAFGLQYERLLAPNFGVGAAVHYATYKTSLTVGPITGTWEYRALAVQAFGSFHFDLFKVPNLDTYISAGVGHTSLKSRWSSNSDLPAIAQADGSSSYLTASLGARYFINSEWAFVGALTVPGGALSLGMDYLF